MGTLKTPPPLRYWVTESGHKVFYNFKSFTYLQSRMVKEGIFNETY